MSKTVAMRVATSFNALTVGDVIHVDPDDPYYHSLRDIGLIEYVNQGDNPGPDAGQVLNVTEDGDTTAVLGVMPAATSRRRRKAATEETDDGAGVSE